MTRILIALTLAGCGWNQLPEGRWQYSDLPLWAADEVVATSGGLYVRLPRAGTVVRITSDGQVDPIDLGPRRVTRIAAAPDGDTIVAFAEASTCSPDDRRELRLVRRSHQCAASDLTVEPSIHLVTGTVAQQTQQVDGAYNAVTFSDDGRFGVAHIADFDDLTLDGVVNLNGVAVLDLVDETSEIVSVGFAPDRVLFATDDAGAASLAIVLSRNRVASVDLSERPYAVTRFPLTLDPDVVREPSGVALTPDGRYALISVAGSADLYVIDLVDESINIVDLESPPVTLQVDDTADRTVLVYGSLPVVEIMEHDFFTVDRVALDEGMDHVTTRDGTALLWGTASQHDLYRLDLQTRGLVEYALQNPAVSLHVAPTGEYALALTRPESGQGGSGVDALYDANPGLEIVDLRDDESVPFLLEGQGLGVEFVADETRLDALILQRDVDYLLSYSLYTGETEEVVLSEPPVAIGTLPGSGRFWITHDTALGLVSFYDPASGELVEVAGFAAAGLLDPIRFAADPEVSP